MKEKHFCSYHDTLDLQAIRHQWTDLPKYYLPPVGIKCLLSSLQDHEHEHSCQNNEH